MRILAELFLYDRNFLSHNKPIYQQPVFALCDEQPGCPRSPSPSSITSRAGVYRLLPQAARSHNGTRKQMPLSASLRFLSCSRFSPSITSPRWRVYRCFRRPLRSLMAREKQMPLSASLVFLSCSLYSTIGLKGNTVNGMTFKPIQIWYYSSLVASWEQISRLREKSAPRKLRERHFMSKGLRSSGKHRRCAFARNGAR